MKGPANVIPIGKAPQMAGGKLTTLKYYKQSSVYLHNRTELHFTSAVFEFTYNYNFTLLRPVLSSCPDKLTCALNPIASMPTGPMVKARVVLHPSLSASSLNYTSAADISLYRCF